MNMISLMAMATRLPVVTNVSNALDNRRKPPRQANYILHVWKIGSSPVLAWFLQSSSESPGGLFPDKAPPGLHGGRRPSNRAKFCFCPLSFNSTLEA